jgi:hypothetical protein
VRLFSVKTSEGVERFEIGFGISKALLCSDSFDIFGTSVSFFSSKIAGFVANLET